jgi:hypothetical protein
MSLNELLALLGRSWSRLLVYPGGLSMLLVLLAVAGVRGRIRSWHPADLLNLLRQPLRRWRELSALVVPWLALAFMPLPRAVSLSFQFDLLLLLFLCEWPLWLCIADELPEQPQQGIRRLSNALNAYPLLIVSCLCFAAAYGTIEASVLGRAPDENTSLRTWWAFWLGALGLLASLPVLLQIGPFYVDLPTNPYLAWGLGIRQIALAAFVSMPWYSVVARIEVEYQAEADFSWIGMAIPMLGIALLIWLILRVPSTQRKGWAWAYFALSIALLAALWYLSFDVLQTRLA